MSSNLHSYFYLAKFIKHFFILFSVDINYFSISLDTTYTEQSVNATALYYREDFDIRSSSPKNIPLVIIPTIYFSYF